MGRRLPALSELPARWSTSDVSADASSKQNLTIYRLGFIDPDHHCTDRQTIFCIRSTRTWVPHVPGKYACWLAAIRAALQPGAEKVLSAATQGRPWMRDHCSIRVGAEASKIIWL